MCKCYFSGNGIFTGFLQGWGCEGGVLICAGVWEMPCLGLSHSLYVILEWAAPGGPSQGQASSWEAKDNSYSKYHFNNLIFTSKCFLKNKQNPLTFNANLLQRKNNYLCSIIAIKIYKLLFRLHIST